jgi:hypothetical protein
MQRHDVLRLQLFRQRMDVAAFDQEIRRLRARRVVVPEVLELPAMPAASFFDVRALPGAGVGSRRVHPYEEVRHVLQSNSTSRPVSIAALYMWADAKNASS